MKSELKPELLSTEERYDPDGIYEEVQYQPGQVENFPGIIGQLITWYQCHRSARIARQVLNYIETYLSQPESQEDIEIYCQYKRLHKHWSYIVAVEDRSSGSEDRSSGRIEGLKCHEKGGIPYAK